MVKRFHQREGNSHKERDGTQPGDFAGPDGDKGSINCHNGGLHGVALAYVFG